MTVAEVRIKDVNQDLDITDKFLIRNTEMLRRQDLANQAMIGAIATGFVLFAMAFVAFL